MKLFIAGHRGMVGSALTRRFARVPGVELVLRDARELDLTNQAAVDAFFAAAKPDAAIIAAARVGGIHANNTYPAEFLQVNLAIALHSIHAAYRTGVKRLLFLGSSCIYPQLAPQPIVEDSLLTGPSNRPTKRTPSPRSPASSSANSTAGSTACCSTPRCPPTSTGPATTIIRKTPTCCPP
jgi:nucleoside-diphosphate-sugar epimerase